MNQCLLPRAQSFAASIIADDIPNNFGQLLAIVCVLVPWFGLGGRRIPKLQGTRHIQYPVLVLLKSSEPFPSGSLIAEQQLANPITTNSGKHPTASFGSQVLSCLSDSTAGSGLTDDRNVSIGWPFLLRFCCKGFFGRFVICRERHMAYDFAPQPVLSPHKLRMKTMVSKYLNYLIQHIVALRATLCFCWTGKGQQLNAVKMLLQHHCLCELIGYCNIY